MRRGVPRATVHSFPRRELEEGYRALHDRNPGLQEDGSEGVPHQSRSGASVEIPSDCVQGQCTESVLPLSATYPHTSVSVFSTRFATSLRLCMGWMLLWFFLN